MATFFACLPNTYHQKGMAFPRSFMQLKAFIWLLWLLCVLQCFYLGQHRDRWGVSRSLSKPRGPLGPCAYGVAMA